MMIFPPSGDHDADKFSPCSDIDVGVRDRNAITAEGSQRDIATLVHAKRGFFVNPDSLGHAIETVHRDSEYKIENVWDWAASSRPVPKAVPAGLVHLIIAEQLQLEST